MQLNSRNTSIESLRAAWKRDWARLVAASEDSQGAVRHIYNDRPEAVDSQVWEARCRNDYRNAQDFYGLETLETEAVVS